MGLTRCYKTTVFFTFIIDIDCLLKVRGSHIHCKRDSRPISKTLLYISSNVSVIIAYRITQFIKFFIVVILLAFLRAVWLILTVARCRCCGRRRCRGHRCAGGVWQCWRATVVTPGEWRVRRLAVANGPNIFQMLLVFHKLCTAAENNSSWFQPTYNTARSLGNSWSRASLYQSILGDLLPCRLFLLT